MIGTIAKLRPSVLGSSRATVVSPFTVLDHRQTATSRQASAVPIDMPSRSNSMKGSR